MQFFAAPAPMPPDDVLLEVSVLVPPAAETEFVRRGGCGCACCRPTGSRKWSPRAGVKWDTRLVVVPLVAGRNPGTLARLVCPKTKKKLFLVGCGSGLGYDEYEY